MPILVSPKGFYATYTRARVCMSVTKINNHVWHVYNNYKQTIIYGTLPLAVHYRILNFRNDHKLSFKGVHVNVKLHGWGDENQLEKAS